MKMRSGMTFAAILAFSASLLAFDKGIDLSISTDVTDPIEKAKIDVRSSFLFPTKTGSNYVLSPRISTYMNGDFDLNFGIGVRKLFKDAGLIFGHHIFYDFCHQKKSGGAPLHQTGISLEVLAPMWDARLNYYHPISALNRKFKGPLSTPQKWIELETLYKIGVFSVGLVPSYNFTSKEFSVRPKINIPVKLCSIEAGINICPQNIRETSSYIAVSMPLYRMGSRTVSRSSAIRNYLPKCCGKSFLPEKKSLMLF